jgi:hypothetical protein
VGVHKMGQTFEEAIGSNLKGAEKSDQASTGDQRHIRDWSHILRKPSTSNITHQSMTLESSRKKDERAAHKQ